MEKRIARCPHRANIKIFCYHTPMPTIRHAIIEDVEAIHALGKNISEFSVNNSTVTFWPKEILASAVKSDDVIILVAEESNNITGFIIANYNKGLRKAVIENIYVNPEKRGAGIGGKLLKKLLNVLRKQNCEYVATLIPTDGQGALDMYEHAGFKKGDTFLWLDKTLSSGFAS